MSVRENGLVSRQRNWLARERGNVSVSGRGNGSGSRQESGPVSGQGCSPVNGSGLPLRVVVLVLMGLEEETEVDVIEIGERVVIVGLQVGRGVWQLVHCHPLPQSYQSQSMLNCH